MKTISTNNANAIWDQYTDVLTSEGHPLKRFNGHLNLDVYLGMVERHFSSLRDADQSRKIMMDETQKLTLNRLMDDFSSSMTELFEVKEPTYTDMAGFINASVNALKYMVALLPTKHRA